MPAVSAALPAPGASPHGILQVAGEGELVPNLSRGP